MQIHLTDFINPLLKLVLRFTIKSVDQQNSYTVFNSPTDAKLEDCIDRRLDDLYLFFGIKSYDRQVDELKLFKSKKTSEQLAEKEQMDDQNTSSTSRIVASGEIDYVEVKLPISKSTYEKIIVITLEHRPLLTVEESYEIIVSNLCCVLDNRLSITCAIVLKLQNDHNMLELLYSHHCKKIHKLLLGIHGFTMDEIDFIQLCHSEYYPNEVLNILKELNEKNADGSAHKEIFNIRLCIFHWENSFLNFMEEVRKNICFVLIDPKGQRAVSLPIDANPRAPIVNINLKNLKVGYMFHHLMMNHTFLQVYERILSQKFNIEGTRSKVTLEICFAITDTDDFKTDTVEIRDMLNELLSCKFLCGGHVAQLIFYFDYLDVELNTEGILQKKCLVFLDNCGSNLLRSLRAKIVSLHMENMTLIETVELNTALESLYCVNIVLKNNEEIIINKGCTDITLVNVEGLIRLPDFGVIKCFGNSLVLYGRKSLEDRFNFKMTNVHCESDFSCSMNIESFVLENVTVIPPFVMSFDGTHYDIVIKNCDGHIDLTKLNVLNSLTYVGLILQDAFNLMPFTISNLFIHEAKIEKNVDIDRKVDTLTMSDVVMRNECRFKLQQECSDIMIEKLVGQADFFNKVRVKMPITNSIDQEFIFQREEDGLFRLYAISSALWVDPIILHNAKTISLINVEFEEAVSLNVDENIEELIINNFKGTFTFSGGISGVFVNEEPRTCLVMTKPFDEQFCGVAIMNSLITERTMEISCKMNELVLVNVHCNVMPGFRISNNCKCIELENYTGFIDIQSGPRLGMLSLVDGSLRYHEVSHSLSLDGEIYLSTCFVSRRIKRITIHGVTVNASSVLFLHDGLECIEISGSQGTVNLEGLYNINSVTLNYKSVIRMENLQSERVTINLRHLILDNSLIVSQCIEKLILKNVTFLNNYAVEIGSRCQLILIDHSACEIHWPNSTGLDKIECCRNGSYDFSEIGGKDQLSLFLDHLDLTKEMLVPGNIKYVCIKKCERIDALSDTNK